MWPPPSAPPACSIIELAPAQRAPTRDPRVRAAFVMAPLGVFFGPDAFRDVRAPVFLAWATADEALLPTENAEPVARTIATLAGTRVVTGAGHYVFLAPCSAELAAMVTALCTDPAGIDRAQIHAALDADAVGFFAARLPSVPTRAASRP